MKKLKFVFPLIGAVAVVLALAGIASATGSSTVICKKTKSDPCTNPAEAGTQFNAVAVNPVLSTSWATLTCTNSTLGVKLNETSGQPLGATITQFSSIGCKTTSGTSCLLTAHATPYNAQIEATSEFNGALTVSTGSAGIPGWNMTCGQLWNCDLSVSPVTFDWLGGKPSRIVAQNEILNRSGLCPKTVTFSADWVIEPSTTAFYVSHL